MPTAVNDANPFVSQCSLGHPWRFSLGQLAFVKRIGPRTAVDGDAGELVKCLSQKLTRGPATGDVTTLAALSRDGRDANRSGKIGGRSITSLVVAQCRNDPRSGSDSTRQRADDRSTHVLIQCLANFTVVISDGLVE